MAKLTYVLEGAERDSDRYDACMAWEDQLNFLVGDECAEIRPRYGRDIDLNRFTALILRCGVGP